MTLEWLAGFFDGEGCVSLQLQSNGGRYLRMQVSQKDVSILHEIKKRFGGHIYTRSGNPGECSQITWNNEDALCLAEDLLPYSYCKRDQLSLLLQAAQVPPKERESLHQLVTHMKSLPYVSDTPS